MNDKYLVLLFYIIFISFNLYHHHFFLFFIPIQFLNHANKLHFFMININNVC